MNLTYRYSAIQFTHWASSSGAAAFATTYLLNKGVPSGMVGFLLALAGLCSCLSQPVLASLADRAEKFVLTKMLLIMSVLCSVCILLQLLPGISIMLMAVLYMVSIWSHQCRIQQCGLFRGLWRSPGNWSSSECCLKSDHWLGDRKIWHNVDAGAFIGSTPGEYDRPCWIP